MINFRNYCLAGVGTPTQCAAGLFGSSTAMTVAVCSGMCSSGVSRKQCDVVPILAHSLFILKMSLTGYFCGNGSTSAYDFLIVQSVEIVFK